MTNTPQRQGDKHTEKGEGRRMSNFYTGKQWRSTRDAAIERDGKKCAKCGAGKNLMVHHVVPRKEGGSDDLQNLITVCKSCHIYEHMKISEELRGTGPYNPTLKELGLEEA